MTRRAPKAAAAAASVLAPQAVTVPAPAAIDETVAIASFAPDDPLVVRRVEALHRRAGTDAIFAAEVADFMGRPFSGDGEGGAVARIGPRRCVIRAAEVVLSHDSWPGSKRIPI